MNSTPSAGRQDRRSAVIGCLMAVTFLLLLWNTIALPRTALDQRAFLRAVHGSLGLVVTVLALIRLAWWSQEPRPQPPPGLPLNSFGFSRAILMALVLTFAATGVIGFLYAWADGQEVALFGIAVPHLLAQDRSLRTTMGYLHSALGFYYLMLFVLWLTHGVYQHVRYRAGLLRLLPGSRV
jgi:cytochrome b561